MGSAERIVITFGTLGETGQAAALPQGTNAVAPTGQYFVRITLMTDIPDQTIIWGIEHVMKCDGQFDDAESRTEMTACLGNSVDGLGPQLVGKLLELIGRQVFKTLRNKDTVEQWCLGRLGQEQLQ